MARRTVYVIDDHPIVRDGVASTLAGSQDLELVGFAATGADAVRQIGELAPDVVLLDLRLPDVLAPELIGQLLASSPSCRILLFTAYPEHGAVAAAVEAGACGVVVKDAHRADLLRAIRAVADGATLDRRPGLSGSGVLTAREYDVLRRVAMGQSNPEIGEALFLSRYTVKSYVQSVLQKLDARNRVEAIAKARELGLL